MVTIAANDERYAELNGAACKASYLFIIGWGLFDELLELYVLQLDH